MMDPQLVCEQTGYCIKDFEAMRPKESTFADIAGVINVGPVDLTPEVEVTTEAIIPFLSIERTATGLVIDPEDVEGSKLNCMICKQVAAWAIEKLKDNRTEEAIVQALDEACDTIFSKQQKQQCEAFVKQYADEIISILKQEDDPNLVCALVGVCSVTKQGNDVPKTDGSSVATSSTSEDGAVCEYCLKASQWLNEKLSDSRTEENIIDALNQVCSAVLPQEKVNECETYVREKIDLLVDTLRNSTNPEVICSTLKLCPPSVASASPSYSLFEGDIIIDDTEREVIESQNEPTLFPSCFVCKKIMRWMNDQIKGNRTDEAIEGALSHVCSVFYPRIHNCEMLVAKWSDRILLALKQATEPELGCELLMVCMAEEGGIERNEGAVSAANDNTGANEVEELPNNEQKSDEACFECQSIAHFIQVELYDYNKEKSIDEWVINNVCNKVGNSVAKQTCDSFVEEYGASIIQLVAQRAFDPKVLCEKELKICPQSNEVPRPTLSPVETVSNENPKLEFELVKPSKAETCDMCVQAVKALDQLLASDVVDHEITALAGKVCTYADKRKAQVNEVDKLVLYPI